ncbi:MAG: hypothetical protein WH035_03735 [Spirochaetota bacterium]
MKTKIKYKINFIFTVFLLLIFAINPIMAESTIIIVNKSGINKPDPKNTIHPINVSNALFITDMGVDDNYWASNLPITSDLIKVKSEKMANELRESSEFKSITSAILLGFSQGGLRVRSMAQYLYSIDKSINNKIKGFITLDSPNFGSRIAEKQNVMNLGRYVVDCLSLSARAIINDSFGFSTFLLSYEEENEFNKIDKNIKDYAVSSLSKYIDIEKMKSYIDSLKESNDEKGSLLLTDTGLRFLCENMLGLDRNNSWFYQILNGALEYSSNTAPNVIEIVKEFRPNSEFLNNLNKYDSVYNYEYQYKRVSIIGANGRIEDIQIANDILTKIKNIHWTCYCVYFTLGVGLLFNPFKLLLGLNFLYKSTLNISAMSRWSNLNNMYNYLLTGNKNNFSHDLLITTENQKLPYMRLPDKDKEYTIAYLNHIVPDGGICILVSSLQEIVEKETEKIIDDARRFIDENN